jgi:hypothetical protein
VSAAVAAAAAVDERIWKTMKRYNENEQYWVS